MVNGGSIHGTTASESFCTIVTRSHLSFAWAMHDAVAATHDGHVCLDVLVLGEENELHLLPVPEGVTLVSVNDIRDPMTDQLFQKYGSADMDLFRWSMKPVFMKYLLNHGRRKVLYLDPDIGVFGRMDFLFEALDQSNVLITPHWLCADPFVNPSEYKLQFVGLYNAGFFGASCAGMNILEWWAKVCLYRCSKTAEDGIFADQSHLNLLPVHFDGAGIVRHRGCNLAHWNRSENVRSEVEGRVLINNEFPVIFIHFTPKTIRAILDGRDIHLMRYLQSWELFNQRYSASFDVRLQYGSAPRPRPLTYRERIVYGVTRRLRRVANKLEEQML